MQERNNLPADLAEIVLALLADEATPEQAELLDGRLREDPTLIPSVVELIGQEAWFAWSRISGLGLPEQNQDRDPEVISLRPSTQAPRSRAWISGLPRLAAAVLLLATGVVLGIAWKGPEEHPAPLVHAVQENPPVTSPIGFEARLVSSVACRWSPGSPIISDQQEGLRKGEFLSLLEGIARLRVNRATGSADLEIEGPAGLVLTANGGCSVSHGLMNAKVQAGDDPFVIDTPNCQTAVSQDASLGIVVGGLDVEVHLFEGRASVIIPWGSEELDSQFFELRAGEALKLSRNPHGRSTVTRGVSDTHRFTARTSMQSDELRVPQEYVQDVLSLDPVLYWRFEDHQGDRFANETGLHSAALIRGTVGWEESAGNHFVSFTGGVSPEERIAHLASTHPLLFDQYNGYTLELWMKPSHYHRGVLASTLLRDPTLHGMMLELEGPGAAEFSNEEPGKMRFLHRAPPGGDLRRGHSCFSSDLYKLRRWQHVVAVKDDTSMKLYVDGRLSATQEDNSIHSVPMYLIVGQIDETRQMRQFVGQIDELAFYPSALTEEEVLRHYKTMRHCCEQQKAPEPAPTPPEPAPSVTARPDASALGLRFH